jgi:signal transduction histidine kinase
MYATPVERGGHAIGTVVTALSLTPYERSETRALVASLVFALVVLALFVLATRWAIRRALRPVARMTSEALAWSERDLDHRFNAGAPRDEITQLAAAFDRMLDRLAASLRHEQRFSAEVSHELRTPLAAILAESELALSRERGSGEYRRALEAIVARGRQLERTTETLLVAARAESQPSPGVADATEIAERLVDLHGEACADREVALGFTPPPQPIRVGAEADVAERVVSPLIENACRHALRRVDIRLTSDAHAVRFLVIDDGPGVPVLQRDHVFEPGFRGDAGGSDPAAGAGLGLSLARRLARALGGDVEHCSEHGPGGCFAARLPRA